MSKLLSLKSYVVICGALFMLACKHNEEKHIGSPNHKAASETKADTKKEDAANSAADKSKTVKEDKNDASSKKASGKWVANAASSKIDFSVKGPFGTVNGNLSGLQSTILFDKDNLAASSIHASTNTGSISTGIKLRNKDLQKEKYLDAKKYPTISFKSDKIERSGDGYKAVGQLTIKGVSKPQVIPFSFSEKGDQGVFKGTFTIQRADYGVGSPGGSIGNDITVHLNVPVTKAKSS